MSEFDIAQAFKANAVVRLDNVFDPATIAGWNSRLDAIYSTKVDRARPEVDVDELYDAGIIDEFFNPKMRKIIYDLMPNAVLYHFHSYEIEANQSKSHVLGNRLDGWHSDIGQLPWLDLREPHYASIFVYLSTVDENDGAFEIANTLSAPEFANEFESTKVTGVTGTTFVWNRAALHRASPNVGPIRRRILKISIQNSYLENAIVASGKFERFLKAYQDRDEFSYFLFGGKYEATHQGRNLPNPSGEPVRLSQFVTNSKVRVGKFEAFLRRAIAGRRNEGKG